MIDKRLLNSIKKDTQDFWKSEVSQSQFKEMAAGKEIGHRIADHVDEKTTRMLSGKYHAVHESARNGKRLARSMGDLWIYSQDMYNPVNVKAGEAGKKGQPNLVSLNRLLSGLLATQVDSYYLLIVKIRIETNGIVPHIYLVDLLDYLDFVTFNAGPGQLMLKEKSFYEFCDGGMTPQEISLPKKVEILMEKLEDGHRRLLANRGKRLTNIRRKHAVYSAQRPRRIEQGGLNFGQSEG